ncbi:CDP-glycerol glycerophosphotransferase [Actinoplanes tereljensis]|uniref:Glycosyltransferase 2-like domain-containing protein n=1 Tax=Paractinoplanes tereljensis TaxID=571912 RepID=A0A919TVY4_9ACTN|nr:glycosyltransferase [Actinoplanes tereljensis]GIF25353.1 hypothetical protein Ate02nite_80830 [Actinoplanes tereljensis]
MTPRLSIVVPFSNVERYIEACLDSLARQTFGDFEAILVDDGSKDGSGDAARDFCGRDPRFRLITQENQGPGPARNAGIAQAQGDYLAFADGDDLVPRHAYEIMIRSLDDTASQIAAGNARRFNNTSGVRQSWSHRLPFAINRPATDVYEHPRLALDRMVWNKVYRRTFWDQYKYEFPAMWYEDYPVSLRAYLDAVAVDCLAVPIYYWRERESGESITQHKLQYGNLADRVTSAEMVLDLVGRAPEARDLVHKHLTEIDLVTVVQAFAAATDEELEPLVELGRRLSSRLDPRIVAATQTFQRLEYEALEAGDADLLRRLAQFRAEGHPQVPARRHPARPWRYESQYPGLRDSRLSADLYRLPRAELEARVMTTEMEWTADALVLRGTAEIVHLDDPGMSLRMSLVCGRRSQRLKVTVTPDGFETRVPRSMLARLPGWASSAWISVELRSGLVRRRGHLGPGDLQYALGDRTAGRWIQPVRTPDGRLTLQVRSDVPEVTGAEVDGDRLVLTGRIPTRMTAPTLRLARSAGDVQVPLQRQRGQGMDDFVAEIALDDLIDVVNPDDPFLDRTVLVPRLHDGDDQILLLATGVRHGVLPPRGDRVISLTRSPAQYLNLAEGPVRVTADRVEVDGGRITVSGPRWAGVDYDQITWRRFLPNSDDGVDGPSRLTVDDTRWSAETDLADLAGGENWTLFAVSYAVQTDSFMLPALPPRAGAFALRSRSSILHLETD